jgi:short subunit dehydrogenase-like uncharacterized protein
MALSTLQKELIFSPGLFPSSGVFSLTQRTEVQEKESRIPITLEVASEVAVFEALQYREARTREVMVMPGIGFFVSASDCLAVHAAKPLPNAHSLLLGVSRTDVFSRGSLKTIPELAHKEVMIRRGGKLMSIPIRVFEHQFDYGDGVFRPDLVV